MNPNAINLLQILSPTLAGQSGLAALGVSGEFSAELAAMMEGGAVAQPNSGLLQNPQANGLIATDIASPTAALPEKAQGLGLGLILQAVTTDGTASPTISPEINPGLQVVAAKAPANNPISMILDAPPEAAIAAEDLSEAIIPVIETGTPENAQILETDPNAQVSLAAPTPNTQRAAPLSTQQSGANASPQPLATPEAAGLADALPVEGMVTGLGTEETFNTNSTVNEPGVNLNLDSASLASVATTLSLGQVISAQAKDLNGAKETRGPSPVAALTKAVDSNPFLTTETGLAPNGSVVEPITPPAIPAETSPGSTAGKASAPTPAPSPNGFQPQAQSDMTAGENSKGAVNNLFAQGQAKGVASAFQGGQGHPAASATPLEQLLYANPNEAGKVTSEVTPAARAVEVANADMPRAISSAPAQVTTVTATAARIIDTLGLRIARAVSAKESSFTLRMDPPELGRIEVKMDFASDSRLRIHVVAETREALSSLQRDAGSLERALNDAGVKTDQGTMNFSLKGDGQRDHGESQAANELDAADADANGDDTFEDGHDDPLLVAGAAQAASDNLLDIRV